MSTRTHDWETCEMSTWQGDPRRCRWCNRPLRGNSIFHSRECLSQAVENHAWKTARERVRTRDRHRCTHCGARRRLEVHHLTPCAGHRTFSCAHHLPNLTLLCDLCHGEAHAAA